MVCYCEKCYQEKYGKKDEQGEIIFSKTESVAQRV